MGQHFWQSENLGPYAGTLTDDESRIRDYVDSVIEGMRTGSFSYLAHPDLINYQGLDSVYEWEMTRLCRELKELGIPLEINILGMGEGARHYPAERFWKIAGEIGNKVILGLDAHSVRQLKDVESYNACMQLADKYNLDLINELSFK
jgi:histidinol-phosphatase (PHP family)